MSAPCPNPEVEKFSQRANSWWDPEGAFKTLHDINPLRLAFIETVTPLADTSVLDVGCGGGILTEAMAQKGAKATGIDLSAPSVEIAKAHAKAANLNIDYYCTPLENFPRPNRVFDVITCMELLEHVEDPKTLIQNLTTFLKPGGWLFLSTLNRNFKSFLFAIIGAEYLLNLLPKGTHDYGKFIQPAELSALCRDAGLSLVAAKGLKYDPLGRQYSLGQDLSVNYLAVFQKPVL